MSSKKTLAKRDLEWKQLRLDEYTISLIERAVMEGKANSRVQAVNMGVCLLLGIKYKRDEEILMEIQMEQNRIIAASIVRPPTLSEQETNLLQQLDEVRAEIQRRAPRELTAEEAAMFADSQRIAAEKLAADQKRREVTHG